MADRGSPSVADRPARSRTVTPRPALVIVGSAGGVCSLCGAQLEVGAEARGWFGRLAHVSCADAEPQAAKGGL